MSQVNVKWAIQADEDIKKLKTEILDTASRSWVWDRLRSITDTQDLIILAIEPQVIPIIKERILQKLQKDKSGKRWEIVHEASNGRYPLGNKALSELVSEGKVEEKRGGWLRLK